MNATGSRIPWLALGTGGALLIGWVLAWLIKYRFVRFPRCTWKLLTGIPCPTCGISRCGLAFARGDIGAAFHWHPLVALLVLLAPFAILWDLHRAWKRQPYPALPEHPAARLGVAGLLLLAWIFQILRDI